MRILLIVCLVVCAAACSGNSTSPTAVSSGTTAMSIAGTWDGTFVSSNNETAEIRMVLTQSGSDVSGTWDSSSVAWSGDVTGKVSGSTFNGQFKFARNRVQRDRVHWCGDRHGTCNQRDADLDER